MKNYISIIFGIIIGFLVSLGLCYTGTMPFNECGDGTDKIVNLDDGLAPLPATEPETGISIDSTQAAKLVNDYKSSFLAPQQYAFKGSMGGRIGVTTLAALLDSCRRNSLTYVNFKLGFYPTVLDAKVFFLFSAGTIPYQAKRYPVYRNSGQQSYCPTQCGD